MDSITTTNQLATYMHQQITAAQLHTLIPWTVEVGSYDEIVADVVHMLGADLATLPPDRQFAIRALARWRLWLKVYAALPLFYSYSTQGSSFSRQQTLTTIQALITQSQSEALAAGITHAMVSGEAMAVIQPISFGGRYATDEWG